MIEFSFQIKISSEILFTLIFHDFILIYKRAEKSKKIKH
jgi:hypothetical protein